jgi:hypothetical protein
VPLIEHTLPASEQVPGAARFARLLTFAGAIPFAGLALALFMPDGNEYLKANAGQKILIVQLLTTYAAVILSFLGGIQWGIGLSIVSAAPRSAKTLFCLSVLPSLFAWAMLFIAHPTSRILVAIGLFGFVWIIDTLLNLQKLIPAWFYKLRTIITAIVITSLTASLITLPITPLIATIATIAKL